MTDYTINNALIDIGFICGYMQEHCSGSEDSVWYAAERVEDLVTKGYLYDGQSPAEAYKSLLLGLGELRGTSWHKPIADAVSVAFDRVIKFYSAGIANWRNTPTPYTPDPLVPPSEELSDDNRDLIAAAADSERGNTTTKVLAEWVEKPALSVMELLGRLDIPVGDYPSSDKEREVQSAEVRQTVSGTGGRGAREWTAEQRAEQAERARNYAKANPLVKDTELGAVKADWEAGLTFDAIGRKHGCSGSHIRNFLKKHGIDPRRGRQPLAEPSLGSENENADKVAAFIAVHGVTKCPPVGSKELGKLLISRDKTVNH